MFAEMSVKEACLKFDEFRDYVARDDALFKDLLTDQKYIVRVDMLNNGAIRFEVGYPEDKWNIH